MNFNQDVPMLPEFKLDEFDIMNWSSLCGVARPRLRDLVSHEAVLGGTFRAGEVLLHCLW